MSLTTEVAALLPITTENRKTCGIATNMAWTDGKLTLTWFLKWKRDWLTATNIPNAVEYAHKINAVAAAATRPLGLYGLGLMAKRILVFFFCILHVAERRLSGRQGERECANRQYYYVSLDGRWQFLVVCLPQPWLRFDTWFGLLTLTMVGRLVGWLVDWLRMRRYDFGLELQGGLGLMFVVAVW